MKKICMVAYTNYLNDARPRREAEALVRRGDQVDFIALGEKDAPSFESVHGVRVFRVKQLKYRGGAFLKYGFSYLRFLLASTAKLLRLHWKERYDIVYVHTMPDLLVLVALIPKLFGCRVILNIHDMMPEMYMSKFGLPEKHPLIRLLAMQEQFSIWLANKAICVHHPHRDVLVRRGTPIEKLIVLPNVPDPRMFRSETIVPPSDGTFRIVYHGTIARRLGLDIAVKAFVKAADACPRARLEIYGDGDAGEELDAQIKEAGMGDRIYFSKKMFRVESVGEMIQGASLGLIPNRRDVATDYMLPVKLLEYVHLGIPVIAPRLLAIQYYFNEDQVVYYEPGDVDELAECIRSVYANPEKQAELAKNSAEFAKKFQWDQLKEELFKVVDDAPASLAGAAA
jgi:glycosyltransferase involved in cell wall biosynthesis